MGRVGFTFLASADPPEIKSPISTVRKITSTFKDYPSLQPLVQSLARQLRGICAG
jgi:hypothetical protein